MFSETHTDEGKDNPQGYGRDESNDPRDVSDIETKRAIPRWQLSWLVVLNGLNGMIDAHGSGFN